MTEGPERPNPEPAPAPPAETAFAWTPELASGHLPGESRPATRSRWARPLWLLVIVVSVVAAINNLGRVDSTASDPSRAAGGAVGLAFAPLIWGVILWAAVVLVARLIGRRRSMRGSGVPLIALAFMLVGLIVGSWPVAGARAPTTAAGAVTPSPSPSPSPSPGRHTLDEVLVIDPPYRLEAAPPEEASAIVQLITEGDQTLFKSIETRRIRSGSELIGYALIADANVTPGLEALYLGQFEKGVDQTAATKTHATLGGRDVLIGVSDGAGFAVWIEAPYLKLIFTTEPADARKVAEKFVLE